MRRIILCILMAMSLLAPIQLGVSSALASPAQVFSGCGNGSANGTPDVCQDAKTQNGNGGNNNPIIGIIQTAIDIISYLIGAAAIIGIVVSSIRLMTSGGDSQAVANARSGLIYSVVGIAIAVLAQFLVSYVLSKVQ